MPSTPDPQAPGCEACGDEGETLRCTCGSLIARYVAGAIELKCRRCKRIVLVPLDGSPAA